MKFRIVSFLIFSLIGFTFNLFAQRAPILSELIEVSTLPAEVPQKAGSIAYDGRVLWIPIFHERGRYVTFDPHTNKWNLDQNPLLRDAIYKAAGNFTAPAGVVFVDENMWIGSSYGDSFAWINVKSPSEFQKFTKLYKPDLYGSQTYSALAYDGSHIWAAWHSFNGKAPISQTQLLLKIDKSTGEILDEFPIPFTESGNGALGLTWDGANLWYAAGNRLLTLNRRGQKLAEYKLQGVSAANGLAWDGSSLWIIGFYGKLWKLPLK